MGLFVCVFLKGKHLNLFTESKQTNLGFIQILSKGLPTYIRLYLPLYMYIPLFMYTVVAHLDNLFCPLNRLMNIYNTLFQYLHTLYILMY